MKGFTAGDLAVIEKMKWLEPQPVGKPENYSGALQRMTYYRKMVLRRKFFVKDLTQKRVALPSDPSEQRSMRLVCAWSSYGTM